jgi:hypothetical protein
MVTYYHIEATLDILGITLGLFICLPNLAVLKQKFPTTAFTTYELVTAHVT